MDELIARLRAVSETGCDPDLPHEAADAIEALVRRAEDAEQLATARGHTINGLRNELQAARLERDDIEVVLELERMRLAACGVVALSDTPESAAKSRAMNDEYRSASCDDVARRVDECMALRAERDSLVAKLKELEGQEPVAEFRGTVAMSGRVLHVIDPHGLFTRGMPLFARPVPAEPVNARLLSAARAVVARWETPLWKDAPATAGFIYELRDAIAAAESAPKAVRLTAEELDACKRISDAGHMENTSWSQRLARAIESAALRKNGIEVAE